MSFALLYKSFSEIRPVFSSGAKIFLFLNRKRLGRISVCCSLKLLRSNSELGFDLPSTWAVQAL